jgi:hypothetical protein
MIGLVDGSSLQWAVTDLGGEIYLQVRPKKWSSLGIRPPVCNISMDTVAAIVYAMANEAWDSLEDPENAIEVCREAKQRETEAHNE